MKHFYKYTSLNFIESAIKYGAYASRLDRINDPYECEGILYPNDFRVSCLTKSSSQMLMWSYYNNHRGCVLKYAFPDDIYGVLLKPVAYSNIYVAHRFLSDEEIIDSLYKKGREWKKENEVRAVYHAKKHDATAWNHVDEEVYLKARVETVYLGILSHKDSKYQDAIHFIKEYNQENSESINVKKYILSDRGYKLVLDTQFDYNREV